jgi:hypothetical protein
MSLQLSKHFGNPTCNVVITSPCHVERPCGETCCSVSLNDSTLNGVETSVTVKRCFDSVFCKLTTLIVTFKRSAWVAQHDELGINGICSRLPEVIKG